MKQQELVFAGIAIAAPQSMGSIILNPKYVQRDICIKQITSSVRLYDSVTNINVLDKDFSGSVSIAFDPSDNGSEIGSISGAHFLYEDMSNGAHCPINSFVPMSLIIKKGTTITFAVNVRVDAATVNDMEIIGHVSVLYDIIESEHTSYYKSKRR